MQKNIIIAGVGGQGILSIAAVIDWAALEKGYNVKQAEVHGMSQRGGAVQSHLRISDVELYSDLIPEGEADLILSVEPMEALRYLPYLSNAGRIVTSVDTFRNIAVYPEEEKIFSKLKEHKGTVLIQAENIALDCGNKRMSNMVMLGAAASSTGIDAELLEDGIKALFGRKGEDIVSQNIKAFREGMALDK